MPKKELTEVPVNEPSSVSDEKADQIIAMCRQSVLDNQTLGGLVSNMYSRLQALEKELTELKAVVTKQGGSR